MRNARTRTWRAICTRRSGTHFDCAAPAATTKRKRLSLGRSRSIPNGVSGGTTRVCSTSGAAGSTKATPPTSKRACAWALNDRCFGILRSAQPRLAERRRRLKFGRRSECQRDSIVHATCRMSQAFHHWCCVCCLEHRPRMGPRRSPTRLWASSWSGPRRSARATASCSRRPSAMRRSTTVIWCSGMEPLSPHTRFRRRRPCQSFHCSRSYDQATNGAGPSSRSSENPRRSKDWNRPSRRAPVCSCSRSGWGIIAQLARRARRTSTRRQWQGQRQRALPAGK